MKVSIDKLQEGMVLSGDLLNLNDELLLAAGTVLTGRHLRILKTWGVRTVPIVGADESSEEVATRRLHSSTLLAAAEARVQRRLKHVPVGNPVFDQIRALAVQRTADRMARPEAKLASTKP